MLAEQIGALVRGARKDMRLSQSELARRAGVSHRLLAELERGERPNVSLETGMRILGVLGIRVELTDPNGVTREITDPDATAAARHARAERRRATWSGRQIQLEREGTAPTAGRASSRLAAVSLVTQQAYALAKRR
jgi:transcriptional regulator with XRE-family HTH domain